MEEKAPENLTTRINECVIKAKFGDQQSIKEILHLCFVIALFENKK